VFHYLRCDCRGALILWVIAVINYNSPDTKFLLCLNHLSFILCRSLCRKITDLPWWQHEVCNYTFISQRWVIVRYIKCPKIFYLSMFYLTTLSDYIPSKNRLERMWKESNLAYFKYHPDIRVEVLSENHENPQAEKYMFRPRFEPSTFQIQIRNVVLYWTDCLSIDLNYRSEMALKLNT
jgi:hypothetical protein